MAANASAALTVKAVAAVAKRTNDIQKCHF